MVYKGYYKKLKLSKLLDSELFPYAVAVLQSRAKKMTGTAFMVTSQDAEIIQRTREVLTSVLGLKVYHATLRDNSSLRYRMKLNSVELMDFLRIITLENKRVPYFIREIQAVEQRKNYIRGFLDSRAEISFYHSKLKRKKYPRIGLTTNQKLINSFAYVLKLEDLAPRVTKNFLHLYGNENAHRVIESGLMTNKSKLERLVKFHTKD